MAEATRPKAYAAALYAVANAEGQLTSVGNELFTLARAIEENDALRDALGDARLPAERRQQIIEELLPRRCMQLRRARDDAVEIEQKGCESGQVDDDVARRFLQRTGPRRTRQIGPSRAGHCASGLVSAAVSVLINRRIVGWAPQS